MTSCFRLLLFQGGRLIAGWEDKPFRGQLHIKLRGNHRTPDWPLPQGPNQGSKVLGEKTASETTKTQHNCYSNSNESLDQNHMDVLRGVTSFRTD